MGNVVLTLTSMSLAWALYAASDETKRFSAEAKRHVATNDRLEKAFEKLDSSLMSCQLSVIEKEESLKQLSYEKRRQKLDLNRIINTQNFRQAEYDKFKRDICRIIEGLDIWRNIEDTCEEKIQKLNSSLRIAKAKARMEAKLEAEEEHRASMKIKVKAFRKTIHNYMAKVHCKRKKLKKFKNLTHPRKNSRQSSRQPSSDTPTFRAYTPCEITQTLESARNCLANLGDFVRDGLVDFDRQTTPEFGFVLSFGSPTDVAELSADVSGNATPNSN